MKSIQSAVLSIAILTSSAYLCSLCSCALQTVQKEVPQQIKGSYGLFADDKLTDKKPVFDPELVDSRPLKLWENELWEINASAAVIGLGMNQGAYLAEVFRGGIEALHKGQREAALAVGMTPSKAYRYIIMPQAVRIVLPPLLNMLIILLKDSSVCSLISTPELMLRTKDLASMSFLPMHAYLLAGLIYFLMACPLSLMTQRVERRLRRGMRSVTA